MNVDTIQITKRSRKHWDGSMIHTFAAHCLRCDHDVPGASGSHAWYTKPPAVRAAHMHVDVHLVLADRHANNMINGDLTVVGTVPFTK